jgi:3-dehydroquinate synthase II
MLVGNSSAFTFLVNAETESNPYVAPRPFRINAGAVHAYAGHARETGPRISMN